MQRKPLSPIFFQADLGTIPASSHSSTYGITSFAKNFFTESLKIL